jgi:hypothetical protein
MGNKWIKLLHLDPISALLQYRDPSLDYFVRRDLREEQVGSIESLWDLAEPKKLFQKQAASGCWEYPSKSKSSNPVFNYNLLETYRSLRVLIDMYGLDRRHPAIQKAAEYVFSCQTGEGDIRGILGNQYMPYYHAVLLEELIKAGYVDDRRVFMGLDWLLTMRQEDGGWIIPLQGVPAKMKNSLWEKASIPPDRGRPFSHLATGMILRAFAAHPAYRQRPEIRKAAGLLKSRFFKADEYYDRKDPEYWLKFQYPFFWTSLLTVLDTLHPLGLKREDPDIQKALIWFINNQLSNGLWPTEYNKGKNAAHSIPWVTLAVCRVLNEYYFN